MSNNPTESARMRNLAASRLCPHHHHHLSSCHPRLSPLPSPPFLSLFVPVGTACLFNVVSPWLPVCHTDVMSLIINLIMLRPRRMYAENRPWHFTQQKDRRRVVHLRILKSNSEQIQVSLWNVCVFTYKIRRYI